MKVLVTGGAGFVGTNLIKRLLEEGHEVVSVDNYNTGLKSNHQEGCLYVEQDIRNVSDYSAWGKFDIVYHLAAIARIQPSFINPEEYFITNAYATMKIAKYCSDKNIPLVYAGSSSHHSGKFKNPYTFSKDVGEEVIQLFEQHYNLRATIVRFYNVYGPYHLKEGGYTTLIGAWEKRVEEGKSLIIYGDGTKRRDFTHVDDIIEGLVLVNTKQAWGIIFELGKGHNYSVNEIADAFGIEVEYKENKPGEAEITLCTDTAARDILGWNPEKDIIDYIKEYLSCKK
jgi:UDP-glucose 4-epimerase